MSTLAVKPRGRVWRRANAHAGGCAGRKAPAPHRSFLEQNKCLVGRRRDYGSGEGRRCSVTPLTIPDASPSGARMNRRAAGVAGKSHFEDFHLDRWHKSQFHRPWRQQFRRGARSGGFIGGLGHVDHLVCGDGGIAEGHGTCAESGAGEDRRRPQALRRLLSTRLPPYLAPPSGAENRLSRRLQQRDQGAAMALEPSRQLEFEQNHAYDRG